MGDGGDGDICHPRLGIQEEKQIFLIFSLVLPGLSSPFWGAEEKGEEIVNSI